VTTAAQTTITAQIQKASADGDNDRDNIPDVIFGRSPAYPVASEALEVRDSQEKGRYVVANQDIPIGSVVMVEDPYAAVSRPEVWKTHCYHCLRKLPLDTVPCLTCTQVFYCGWLCEESCWRESHQYECSQICNKEPTAAHGLCCSTDSPLRQG